VSPGYFSTLALRFHRGRDFSSADRESATRVVIVNELLARRSFGDADPIGRRISVGRAEQRRDLEIVGVVANAKYQTLHEEPRAIAYLPVAQHPSDDALAAVLRIDAAGDGLGDAIRREIRALDRSVPIRIETVGDRIAGSLVVERVIASLASAIGVTALVLAGAALYGLLAYAVSRRRRELGIRVALGADRQAVAWTVLRDCVVVAAVGIAIGLAASLALGRFAAALLFKVAPSDAPSMAIASVVVLIVCVAAALLPARRAVGVDAVTVMRAE
jgi:hypothetical protein